MRDYEFTKIEQKWLKFWEQNKQYETDLTKSEKKLYCLVMFSYPSGDKLHIGHWYNFAPTDSWARFKKLNGYNIFEPMGFDAFGLPAENYAVKTGIHPAKSTAENIKYIRQQLKEMGAMYDWSKEVITCEPEYYKWTQWIFLQLYQSGLAYKKKAPVNWCPSCKTVLANEQVDNGVCERCDSSVIRKDLEQWFFKITGYSDRLLEGLEKIEWPEKTKIMQTNWIGKSYGAEIIFPVEGQSDKQIEVFTTRADTLYGVTYVVLAPEHPLVEKLTTSENQEKVKEYQQQAAKQNDIERTSTAKEKTGVYLGSYAINPVNGEKVPILISDYVLSTYGTGAVMAVPAHDQRDYEFAVKFKLPIKQVIQPVKGDLPQDCAYTEYGQMINSEEFSGLKSSEGIKKVIAKLEKNQQGKATINYKLRDWLISRQRYWGAPIPIINCPKCGAVPVPDKDLPVLLPEDVDFKPSGESPLASSESFVNTTCPKCGTPAVREVDTMDTFVCSSWYFLRYLSPTLSDRPFDKQTANQWLPVDQYVGGAEHAVMHLLYARFITKVLYDLKHINFDEPFKRLIHQGIITRNGAKMSKSKGNVVNPDEYISEFGSDSFRCYMMFMGSYEDGGDWDDSGIHGVHRFINRIWRLVLNNSGQLEPVTDKNLTKKLHQTIKKVTEDLEIFHFNTAIASMMELINVFYGYIEKYKEANFINYFQDIIILISPFAPHIAEELWEEIGNENSIFENAQWPEYDPELIKEESVTIVVQVNGKVRGKLEIDVGTSQEQVKELALELPNIQKNIAGKDIRKLIYVPKKLVSIVV